MTGTITTDPLLVDLYTEHSPANMTSSLYAMPTPYIDWQEGVPCTRQFNDVYYNKNNGLEETRYVFLQQNKLPERWLQHGAPVFRIAETGFGTGLNFLACWQLWLQSDVKGLRLQFISTELFPLSKDQLAQALAAFPELDALRRELLAVYPMLLPGHHRLSLSGGKVILDLIFGDSASSLAAIDADNSIDCWFLDGFAPAQNPAMWNDALWQTIAKASAPGCTLATFTSASAIRHKLSDAGFDVTRVKGFGRKRQMLTGVRATKSTDITKTRPPEKNPPKKPRIAIIGAGLAGAHTAYSLAKRGYEVTVFEAEADIAQKASSNQQGVLYIKLALETSALNEFAIASYSYALQHYLREDLSEIAGEELLTQCGVLQLMQSDKNQKIFDKLTAMDHNEALYQSVDPQQASKLTGLTIDHPGVFYPAAGYLSPPQVCGTLLQHPNISVRCLSPVKNVERYENQWRLNDSEVFDTVIICTAEAAIEFEQCNWLPVKPVRGQISQINADDLQYPLKQVICHEGYIAPAFTTNIDGVERQQIALGATFDIRNSSADVDDESNQKNFDSLRRAIPSLLCEQPTLVDAKVGFRCTTPDYLPIVGQIPDRDSFISTFAALRKNAKTQINSHTPYYPNLYLNIGHGSKGLTYTPLSAELIAAQISGEIAPLPKKLTAAVAVERFLYRDLIRNKI